MMATYAPNDTAGNDNTQAELSSTKDSNRYHLTRLFRRRGLSETSEVLKTLLDDATPSSSASVPHYRIEATADTNQNVQGGVRTVETTNRMGLTLDSDNDDASANTARAVTAADVTAIQKMLFGGTDQERDPSTYPTDASGNGGGGKLSGDAY